MLMQTAESGVAFTANFFLGRLLRPELAIEHFARISDASDLPLIVFQYPLTSGLGYPLDTLLRLCERS